MSDEIHSSEPVNGLVDSRRAAAMLGVPVNTFKVWASRSQHAETGIAASMPKAVATLHGQVYLASAIEEFGRTLALSARAARSKERDRGAYFTPDGAAILMARWALRNTEDVVLEPSLGNGQFAIAIRQAAIARGWSPPKLHACELDSSTAEQAIESGAVQANLLHIGDFLAASHWPMVDVVIGNPPYVRLRELNSKLRRSAMRAAELSMGSETDSAGSVWVPFVAKATSHLKPGGRLAFVLPLDFTYVRYARPLWEFLGQSFGRIRVLRFRERVFPDILQNVLILLAEKRGECTTRVELIAHERLSDLPDRIGAGSPVEIASMIDGERAFQLALLPADTREVLSSLEEHIAAASQRAKFNIGYVAGNKRFFHPTSETIKHFKLPSTSLAPTVSSSRQLSGQGLLTSEMIPGAMLWSPRERLTSGEERYVEQGEKQGVDMAYKCRIRKPWYQVPGVRTPDLILTTFSEVPRLHLNDGDWTASNSVLGAFMKGDENARVFVSSWYSPLTLLSIEIEVHSLGGGVMIAVPREADAVQILHEEVTAAIDDKTLNAALRSKDPTAPYTTGSRSIVRLVGKSGLDSIWKGVEVLMSWRKAQS